MSVRQRRLRRLSLAAVVLVQLSVASLAIGSGGIASPALHETDRAAQTERVDVAAPPTSSLPKLDGRLAAAAAGGMYLRPSMHLYAADGASASGGNVRVVVDAVRVAAVTAAITRLGGRVEASWRSFVQALLPSTSLAALSRLDTVRFVRPPDRLVEDSVPGEEVAASLA